MRSTVILFQIVLLVCLTGCFSSNPKDIEAFSKPAKVLVTAENYILQPPDQIEIHCSKVPEIDLQLQQIRPDGRVSFEGVGEVQAAGIMLLYALTGENPIDVRVVVYKSGFYYVQGQVFLPGPKVCTGRDTVLRALAEARPTVMAWLERIQVIRPSDDESVPPKIFEVNFDRMRAHGDTSKNVLLQEGDIVYVPPTVVSAIALKVAEFIQPIGQAFSTVNITQAAAP